MGLVQPHETYFSYVSFPSQTEILSSFFAAFFFAFDWGFRGGGVTNLAAVVAAANFRCCNFCRRDDFLLAIFLLIVLRTWVNAGDGVLTYSESESVVECSEDEEHRSIGVCIARCKQLSCAQSPQSVAKNVDVANCCQEFFFKKITPG